MCPPSQSGKLLHHAADSVVLTRFTDSKYINFDAVKSFEYSATTISSKSCAAAATELHCLNIVMMFSGMMSSGILPSGTVFRGIVFSIRWRYVQWLNLMNSQFK